MLKDAPFTGQLVEIENRADRIAFARTALELTREGEFPQGTRVIAAGGDFLLTTLDREQIADVCEALYICTYGMPETPQEAEPVGALNRPRSRRIPDEKKAVILKRLMEHVSPADVAREVQLPYQSVYYYMKAARLQRQAEAGD